MDSLPAGLSLSRSALPAPPPSPTTAPTDDAIEAVIQMATSSRASPDGRQGPLRDTRTQLFVGNLPYRVRWQDLKDLFRKAGTVLRADVSLGPDNRSRGFGTVLFATVEDASHAVDMFNGYSWQTRILEVRPDRIPTDFDNPMSVGSLSGGPTSVSMGGSSPYVGPSINVHAMPVTQMALMSIMQEEYNSLMASGSSNNGGRNLFVGNLPFHCQWQDLKDLFRQAGTIVRADVALNQDGRSRGFGTVVFATDADAERGVKMFNGYEYNGRPLKVHHDKFSQPTGTTSPASPPLPATVSFQPGSSLGSQITDPSTHLRLPAGYTFDFGPPSGPSSPFDPYPPQLLGSISSSVSPLTPQSQPLSLLQHQHHSHHTSSSMDSLTGSMLSASVSSNSPTSDQGHFTSSYRPRSSRTRPQSQSHNHNHNHPAHPGPISLPPPPQAASFPLLNPQSLSPHSIMPVSPGHHPMSGSPIHHPHQHQMTPHGLPPITPSMPPFTFLPQLSPNSHPHRQSPHANHATPAVVVPTNMHAQQVISPFSPGLTMSPGAFWGRPGGGANPFINPAVGAPVHGSPGGFFNMSLAMGMSMSPGEEPAGYFPPVDTGYFPPVAVGYTLRSDEVANEILRNKTGSDSGSDSKEAGVESSSPDGVGTANGRVPGSGSSEETLDGRSRDMQRRDVAVETPKGVSDSVRLDDLSGGHMPLRTSSLQSASRRPQTPHRTGSEPIPENHGARADSEPGQTESTSEPVVGTGPGSG